MSISTPPDLKTHRASSSASSKSSSLVPPLPNSTLGSAELESLAETKNLLMSYQMLVSCDSYKSLVEKCVQLANCFGFRQADELIGLWLLLEHLAPNFS
jgi:hypothetical protein